MKRFTALGLACLFALWAYVTVSFGCGRVAPTQEVDAGGGLVAKVRAAAQASATTAAQLRGTNLTGGEMDWGQNNATNPVSGTDYLFVTHQDIDYLAGKGVNFVRLVFSWEGCQPNGINTAFPTSGNSATYYSTFVDRVNYAASKGMAVMVEPHGADTSNFARYKGNFVGSAQVPDSAFADFWSRIATQFKNTPQVMFGLSNEPNTMSTVQWFQAAQAAIVGIRNTGATNMILVPGNGWTGADSWTDDWYDTASPPVSNATAYLKYIKDPSNNVAISVHSYFDANDGGGASDIVSPTIGVERLTGVVNWGRANGVRVQLGEFGTTSSSAAQTAVVNMLNYLNQNTDVVIGWSWWAYGSIPWWSGYMFTLDPSSNYTKDAPQMAWLVPYFVGTSPSPAPTPTPTPTPTPNPPPPTPQLAVTTQVTYDWVTGYCKVLNLGNSTSSAISWKSITIDLKDGHLRGSDSVWGAKFPNVRGTGVTTATSISATNPVKAKGTAQVGVCADRGPTHKDATFVSLAY